jgi:site-specific DNA-methyltransferase (cytosine-N4-specific)
MKEELKKETKKDDWDFRKSDTKEYTHCIHTYPAMMIPQIARKLIHLYGKDAKTLLDPFCGSGTSLVEASLTSNIKKTYGFDLNPLAILISKVKTTQIKPKVLEKALEIILNSSGDSKVPDFKNIDFWFKPQVIKDLTILKKAINKIIDENVKDFFLVCFSETIRKTSNTRNGEFKLYRMPKEKLEYYSPNVFEEFEKIAKKYINGMKEYSKIKTKTKTKIDLFSSMKTLPIKDNGIDLIVTSPPYGDSKTTVAYGQFSRLALQWLDYEDVVSLDNRLLGGKASDDLKVKINSDTLKIIIKKIAEIDTMRAREVLSFYEDFDKVVVQLNRVMEKNGYVCFVVGNRTVKGINIPTDKIMSEMFMSHEKYKHITTHERAIPNKRMPKINSPTNEKGKTSTTMCEEHIFILKKI